MDSLIAEEVAKKDKDFALMWQKRKGGGDEAAKQLLNYYTYGDPNHGQQEQVQYQFSQQDAIGYFDNPEQVAARLQVLGGKNNETRVPGAFSVEDQADDFSENPIGGSIRGGGKMLWNTLAGGANIVKGLGTAIANPIDTVTGVASGIAGAAELGYEAITGNQVAEYNEDGTKTEVADTKNQQVAKAIWDELVTKRYGSLDAAKKTAFEDPLGVIADVLTVVSGAGAVKNLGKVAKAGEASKAINVADTVADAGATAGAVKKGSASGKMGSIVKAPFKGAKKTVDFAGSMSKEVMGLGTGVGRGAIDETLKAARLGTPEGRAAMAEGVKAGTVNEAGALDDVIRNFENARDIRAAEYTSKLESLASMKEPLDTTLIGKATATQFKKFKITRNDGKWNFDVSDFPENSVPAREISTYLDELSKWGTQEGQVFDAVGLDTAKKRLGAVFPTDPKAKAFVTPIQEAIVKVLDDVPGYKDMTLQYREMSNLLDDVKATLGVGGRASRDSALKKLTNSLRNNNDHKGEVLRALLETTGDTTTLPKLAGVAMSAKTPRGIAGVGQAMMLAMSLDPRSLGIIAGRLSGLIVSSPRVVHEFLKALGFAQRQIDKIVEMGRKAGTNKIFSDEFVGGAAMLSRPSEAARLKAEAQRLFEESPGQNE